MDEIIENSFQPSKTRLPNLTQTHIIIFCLIIFAISRGFFFLEYSFIINNITHGHHTLINDIWRWDSPNYAKIALNGYETKYHLGGNYVWLPLWPLVLKGISLNGHLPIQICGIVFNQILLLCSFVLFSNYLLKLEFSRDNIYYGVILLAFAPTNIYFFAGLTEPLFLLFSLICFYCLEKDRLWLAVLIASLMGITKIVGIMFIFPFLYYNYKKCKLSLVVILQCLIICLPLILYMIYLQIHTGDFWAFIHAQKEPTFDRPGFNFTQNIFRQIIAMYNKAQAYDVGAFLISLFITTFVLWRNKLHKQAIFNLMCIIPIFMSGGLWNSFRMCFGLFTAYLAAITISKDLLVIKMLILIFSVVMTFICLFYWLSGSWFFA